MPVKKVVTKPKVEKKTIAKPVVKKTDPFSVAIYSLLGKEDGILKLPKEIFGVKPNKRLLAQTVRVYMTNEKDFTAHTKTRGEVHGTTAKMYKQKGTGRARHGAKTAPIFVGGGVVFGPRLRDVRLNLPKKMKKAALIQALSDKMLQKNILALSGLEKSEGKTKQMAKLMNKLWPIAGSENQKSLSTLILTGEKMDNVVRSTRNIPGVDVLPINLVNGYEVIKHQLLVVTKEAVEKLNKVEEK